MAALVPLTFRAAPGSLGLYHPSGSGSSWWVVGHRHCRTLVGGRRGLRRGTGRVALWLRQAHLALGCSGLGVPTQVGAPESGHGHGF